MPIGPIEHGKFKIENQSDADFCLSDVSASFLRNRNIDQWMKYKRLMPDVGGEELKEYVFNKAKEMLKDLYGIEVK